MATRISVVINTYNEEDKIEKLLNSVSWADEILICDMNSEDKTVQIAKKAGARVIFHKKEAVVEKARNFAISKAQGDWILVLDPDEEVPAVLSAKLKEIAGGFKHIDYIRIPRKNIIFGRFIEHAGWWPDYNIRFFKKGKAVWTNQIHRPPEVEGEGLDLDAKGDYAIVHHSYKTISEFIIRMDRYTNIQAEELQLSGYQFKWQDLIEKPLNEFFSRFFAREGYKEGLHGLSLSLLQAFSELALYLKLWEKKKFTAFNLELDEVKDLKDKSGQGIDYWFKRIKSKKSFLSRLFN